MKRSKFLGDLNGTARRDESGYYQWPLSDTPEAKRYISVTSVLSVLNKPGLNRWYASKEREYVASRIEAVYRGEIKGKELLAELRDDKGWKPASETFRNMRAGLGSAVHHAITKYVLAREAGTVLAWQDEVKSVQPFMQSFHKWFEQEKPEYHFVEGPVFNEALGYAGTSDALVEFRDGTFILDYKISPETNKDHALQVAAYRKADFIGIPATGQQVPMPKTNGGKILLVHENGCKLFAHKGDEREFDMFRAALDLWRWRNTEYSQPKEEW